MSDSDEHTPFDEHTQAADEQAPQPAEAAETAAEPALGEPAPGEPGPGESVPADSVGAEPEPEAPLATPEPAPSPAEPVALTGPEPAPAQPVLVETADVERIAANVAEVEAAAAAPTVVAPVQPTLPEALPSSILPEPGYVQQTGPVYLTAPLAPEPKGNRAVGILIAVLAAIVFAVLDAAAAYLILFATHGESTAVSTLESYLKSYSFWVPAVVFALAFIALVAIVNRAGWWAHVLGSIVVGAFVYAAFFGAALLQIAVWHLTRAEFINYLHQFIQSDIPYVWVAFASTFLAFEVVIWFGLWIARRGAAVKRRNAEAQASYEQQFQAAQPGV